MSEQEVGVLNDAEDYDEDTDVSFYEIRVKMPTYTIRVYAETAEDAEDMALDHLYESFSFSDLLNNSVTTVEEVQ